MAGFSDYGSPPHAWGHYGDAAPCLDPLRFTPTRVGTFRRCGGWPCGQSVHPHTRGDICWSSRFSRFQFGSPPHAWGHWAST